MKKGKIFLMVSLLCLLAGCSKTDYSKSDEGMVHYQSEGRTSSLNEKTMYTYSSHEDDSVRYEIGDQDEYFYSGKRYYIDKNRFFQKFVEDEDGNSLGELPLGRGTWIGYSHYLCGFNTENGVLRIADLDKSLDECIVYEEDLNKYFSADELAQSFDGVTSGGFLCAMNGWIYFATSPISVDHFILMRVRYDGSDKEILSDGSRYEFTGRGFPKATHVVDGVIYTPVYDNAKEQYSYAKIVDNSVNVFSCTSDYYWSIFESDWTL